MSPIRTHQIAAVTVNHNTSAYLELMLRSFFACHPTGLSCSLTVFDNGSTDDMGALRQYAAQKRVPILPSGFPLNTANNSHGEILRRFVLDHPDCTHYLFLDADVCFVQANTIHKLLEEVEQTPTAFGIGPRMSWDGVNEIPPEVRQANPDICDARLHPCCALIPNTRLFRQVVELIGLSCVRYLWAEREEYFDTFKLMTRVMLTHGLSHIISSAMIQHFFAVSYDWDTAETIQHKARMRDQRLQALRMRDEAGTM
jgi:GT2 family glycosyltransferase